MADEAVAGDASGASVENGDLISFAHERRFETRADFLGALTQNFAGSANDVSWGFPTATIPRPRW